MLQTSLAAAKEPAVLIACTDKQTSLTELWSRAREQIILWRTGRSLTVFTLREAGQVLTLCQMLPQRLDVQAGLVGNRAEGIRDRHHLSSPLEAAQLKNVFVVNPAEQG